MAKPFKAGPVAEEIVRLIIDHADDPRLKWNKDRTEVVVDIATIVPDGGSQQTTTARRKRFRNECEKRLSKREWETVRYNKYRKLGSERR